MISIIKKQISIGLVLGGFAPFPIHSMEEMEVEGNQLEVVSKKRSNAEDLSNPAPSKKSRSKECALESYLTQFTMPDTIFEHKTISIDANVQDQIEAQLEYAQMDLLGLGISEPNYRTARLRFSNVSTNPLASPQQKATAQLGLARIDMLWFSPFYENARCLLICVIATPQTTPQDRSKAQLLLADMDRTGLGTDKPNYTAARSGYNFLIINKCNMDSLGSHANLNKIAKSDQMSAQLGLALMDMLGFGIEHPDYPAAREGFMSVVNSHNANLKDQKMAQAWLNKMNKLEI